MIRRLIAASASAAALLAVPQAHAGPVVNPLVIQPGIQVQTPRGNCTANFVFQDADGPFDPTGQLYIGTAGHCGSLNDVVSTTVAAGESPTRLGTIVFEDDGLPDFALIKIDQALNGLVSPSVRYLGGPVGVYEGPGDERVGFVGHGKVIGTGGTPRYGMLDSTGTYAATVTASGDSGGPFVTMDGLAVGLLHCSCGVGDPTGINAGTKAAIRLVQHAIAASGKSMVTCDTATPWSRPGCPPA